MIKGRGLDGPNYIIQKDFVQYLQGPVDLGTSYRTSFRKPLRGSNYLVGAGLNFNKLQFSNFNKKNSYFGRGINFSNNNNSFFCSRI